MSNEPTLREINLSNEIDEGQEIQLINSNEKYNKRNDLDS